MGRENRFSSDTQHRPRKSPRKKLKASRTSASLVIEQLKSGFRRSGDFAQRTRRNWRPQFLIRYLWDNCRKEESLTANRQCDEIVKSRFVPQTPKICSIGLRFGARSPSDDLSNFSSSCNMIKNLKKRLNNVRRPIFTCKYWFAQATSRSTSTDVSLKTHKNHQSTPYGRTSLNKESNVFKHGEIPNSIDRLRQHSDKAKDTSKSLRDNYAAGDRLLVPDPFDNFSVGRDDVSNGSRVKKKDAQIQTSSKKKHVRRKKKTKKRPKLINEEAHEWYFGVDCCNSRNEKSAPSVRVLQKKRAEYIDKFTAVSQQIEEITDALRETCCSEKNWEKNDEFYCSSDRKAREKKPEYNASRIVGKRSTKRVKRKTRDLTSVKKVTRHVDCTNRKHRGTDLSTNVFDDPRAFTIQKTDRCSSGTSGNTQNCRLVRQISFDQDLTKNDVREFFLENDSLDTSLGNNFAISNGYAKDFVGGSFVGKSKYKIIREKAGETIILNDIKRRIDRDFDDLVEKSENDTTEEFFTVSPTKRDNSTRSFCKLTPSGDTSRKRTIDRIRSAPLLAASFDLDCSRDRSHIRDSRSHGCMSDHESSKTSTLSKYFSCAQLSSFVSLDENERANPTVINDSYSSSNSNRYDLDLNANVDRSNRESNLNSIPDFLEYVARYDTARRCNSSCEFPIETINETNDENRRAFAKNPIREHFFLGDRREGDNSRVEHDERHAADFTFETPKRNVDSIDSGVFSSSLIDLYPPESSSFSAGKSELKKKRCNDRKLGKSSSSPIFDFSSDSSCTDDTLDRRVDDVVWDLTKNLILCERRARVKLKEMRRVGTGKEEARRCSRYTHACKFGRRFCDDFFTSPRRSSENDEEIVSLSTPPSLLSDSENENRDVTR